jgi:hypothetical protein
MSASAKLAALHPKDVPWFWPIIKGLLYAAYLRTDLSNTLDLDDDVLRGDAVVWLALADGGIDAAAVTKLVRTDRHLVAVIMAVGGVNMERWIDHLGAIEQWAKREGAHSLRILGRKGWQRKLKGYRVSNVVLERSL